jgi:HK97 family phage portal protein
MSKLLDFFIKKELPDFEICQFTSGEKDLTTYSVKDDRSAKVTYDGIGKVQYGAGIPPAVYNTAVSAVKKYPIVYGCVTARSDAVAGLGIKIFDIKGGQEAEVKDHPYYLLFSNPNPFQGSFEFLEQVSQSLDVTGNAFISIEGAGKALEMYLLPTKYVAIIPDPKIKVKEYRYYINGQQVVYKPEEIIHIKYTDIDDAYYGAPPLASATDILTFESYRIQFANQFFKNSAVPLGMLETEQVLGDSLLRKLRGEWTNIHGGVANSSKIAILQGGLKYKPITPPLKDLELGNLKRLSKEDIQTIFKVPDSILGSLEGTAGKEGKDSLTMFWRSSLIPHLTRIESAINRGLKKQLFKDGKQVFRFNLTNVPALSDSKESIAKYLQILVSSSIMTPNQAMAVIGLPPSADPNADKLMISNSVFGNQMIPADQAGNVNANNSEKPTAKPPKAPAAAKPVSKPPKAPAA